MWKNNFFSILFFLSITSVVSTLYVFKSMRQQQVFLSEFNTNKLNTPLELINTFNYKYPNLSTTSIPLPTFFGMYYFVNKKYEKAIEFFRKGIEVNPYLKVSESFLARTYDELKVKDSFNFYAKKVFYSSPNHPLHLAQYLKSLDLQKSKDTVELEKAFNTITIKQDATWQNYMAAAINANLNYQNLKLNAKKAKELFPSNAQIDIAVNNILYGTENIGKAYAYSKIADSLFNLKNYKASISNYQKALEFYPVNVKFKENLGLAHYSQGNFEESILIFEEIMDNPLKTNNGKIEFALGLSYVQFGEKTKGCELLTSAVIKQFSGAQDAKLKYCY